MGDFISGISLGSGSSGGQLGGWAGALGPCGPRGEAGTQGPIGIRISANPKYRDKVKITKLTKRVNFEYEDGSIIGIVETSDGKFRLDVNFWSEKELFEDPKKAFNAGLKILVRIQNS